MTLDVEAIASAARAKAGVPAEVPLRFLDPLTRLAGALEREAALTDTGLRAVQGSLVAALVTQLQVADAYEQHPGIVKTELPRPVFIIGLLRTGSTLLHNLLGLHPGLRAPALWELMNPVGSYDPAEQEQLASATRAYVEEYYEVAPKLPDIHYLDALRPDECHRLTGLTFATMVYTMRYRVPSYGTWLAEQDLTFSYEYHRELLRAILWRRPGGPFVGKDPFHLWNLAALHQVYPDARYVHLHRDPTETVPSTCSLCSALRVARSDRLDLTEIGRQWLAEVDRGLALAEAARSGPLAGADVLDVRYPDLVADPLGVVGTILDFLGEPMTAEAERRMRGFLEVQDQHRPGAHRYTAADFGLSSADLSRRYAGYRDTYRV